MLRGGLMARGRPATVSRFNPRAGVVLAAQVGLTGFRSALTDLEGIVLADRFEALDVVLGPGELLAAVQRSLTPCSSRRGLSPTP